MIEGIFGVEEAEYHQLYCRFRKMQTREGFGLLKAIGWNIEILNRIECTVNQDLRYPTPKTDIHNNPTWTLT